MLIKCETLVNNNKMKKCLLFFTIILLLFIAVSCGRRDFRRDYFTVTKVVSGNEIKLINGYEVHLIGIDNNKKTKQFLTDKLTGYKVRFVFDSKCPLKLLTPNARDKSFYAYVVSENGWCVNSEVLKNNLSNIPFPQPYLNDSLVKYESYVTNQDWNDPNDYSSEETKLTTPKTNNNTDESELKQLEVACDYNNPTTRDFAVSIAGKSSGEFNVGQVCDIFDAIRPPKWHYVNDPQGEDYFSKASHTIKEANFSGDCDDFAILMYSLMTAIGGDARITFAYSKQGGHAFAELNIGNADINKLLKQIRKRFSDYEIDRLYYRTDSSGNKWLNLDWWASYPGGKYMEFDKSIIFYPSKNYYEDDGK